MSRPLWRTNVKWSRGLFKPGPLQRRWLILLTRCRWQRRRCFRERCWRRWQWQA